MKFTGKYMYKNKTATDIELEHDEYDWDISNIKPVEFIENKGGIKFTRKQTPVFTGVLNYFPDAIREVARVSYVGNQQHNPDKPLHWDRSKSGDELDALSRHLLEAGTIDTDGIRHSAKVAWRALANLQKEIENETK